MTFGGGYAMIPVVERELIRRKNWVSMEELVGHDEEGLPLEAHGLIKDFEQGVPGQFKPDRGHGVVDMPQDVHVPEAGCNGNAKHFSTLV
ncbi:MAG: chromate transporter [Treponema sp.]|jgi:hypothetical protein|nr:chromate transporter [Treponema sp.]